ncbi:MAG: four-carbon acid sugar kinase family protein [Planctomycetota bacterium]
MDETLAALPPLPDESALAEIRRHWQTSSAKVVVLDDDPTGTQTVHDTPVLTTWAVEDLVAELQTEGNLFYILTNSRALPEADAVQLGRELGHNLWQATRRCDRPFRLISRSDSTLRGHYPSEVFATEEALSTASSGATPRSAVHVIAPFFLQGGRYTIDDVHYVAEGERLVPAAETPFARDASFGFESSNLADWVCEKRRDYDPKLVHSVSIGELRSGRIDLVAKRLTSLSGGDTVIVNAAAIEDMHAFAAAALRAESRGQKFVYRTAASFVQAYAGLAPQPLLSGETIADSGARGGLIVVGSYVPKTSAQLACLLENGGNLKSIVLDVPTLLGDDGRRHIQQTIERVNAQLAMGHDVCLHTSRELILGDSPEQHLAIGTSVSGALVETVCGVEAPLRFLIAKGGITSSDVATKGLAVRRAMVMGQVLPGIPVWKLQNESRKPGLAYVVFPGNVGDDAALKTVYEKLRSPAASV